MASAARQWQFIAAAVFVILSAWASQSAASSRALTEAPVRAMHEEWMAREGQVYVDEAEKEERFRIFKANAEYIDAFNRAGGSSYSLGINKFADMTSQEFRALNGYRSPSSSAGTTPFKYENVTDAPSSVDWRKKGAVTPVKNQGRCGCCSAFSAVSATEGITKLKIGELISLSEQELVDCDSPSDRGGEDHGSRGGYMENAFHFIKRNGGLTSEAQYPYRGEDGRCRAANKASVVEITGYEKVPANDENALMKAVANQPVSVVIDAGGRDFQFYSSGVFTGRCGTRQNHGVTAVGYGVADEGEYWLVKNSWGESWGEEGNIRMHRGVDAAEGLCGIAVRASYPIA